MSVNRFDTFELSELQQMYAALHAGQDLFAEGDGNLLPGLSQECSEALTKALSED
jgi:hypothetical protein